MIVLYLLWAPLVWHGRAPQQCSRHVMISFLLFSLQFAYHGGVDAIRDQILSTESLSVQDLTSLFQPFGVCDEYINTTFFKVCVHMCVRVCVCVYVCMCSSVWCWYCVRWSRHPAQCIPTCASAEVSTGVNHTSRRSGQLFCTHDMGLHHQVTTTVWIVCCVSMYVCVCCE